jgi:RHS repeat-associated protein
VQGVTHFTGKERDPESGLDDFDARYYSSQLGRFISADWSAIPEPVPYANLTNPQTLNLYAMVRDNPESFVDLDGHDSVGGVIETVVDATMEEVDRIAGPLIDSAGGSGSLGQAAAEGAALGVAVYVLIDSFSQRNNAEAGLTMQEAKAANDVALRNQQAAQQQPSPQDATHKKRARPSKEEPHQKGAARKRRDRGGEKADEKRRKYGTGWGKRPKKWKGPWPPRPPKPPKPPEPPKPPASADIPDKNSN